jgi:rubredoxin
MNLKDALLCINCDEVFTAAGSHGDPRCPICASSVFAPLSAWVGTWTALEKGGVNRLMHDGVSTIRPRMEVVHSTPTAA